MAMNGEYPFNRTHLHIIYTMQNTGVNLAEDIGPSVLVKNTLQGLVDSGHHVSLLQLAGREIIHTNDFADRHELRTAPLCVAGFSPFLVLESGIRRLQADFRIPYFAFFDSFRFYEACLRLLPKYDLCHEYHGLLSVGTALASKRVGIPYIVTVDADLLLEYSVQGRPLQGIHALIAMLEARMAYLTAERIICVSAPAKRHFVKSWGIPPEKICVVPNGVDINLFGYPYDAQKVRADLGLDGAPVVGFVGGFQKWHGLENLVESFPQVLSEIPQAKLILIGDGPARISIERLVTGLGIANSVFITGLVPQARVPEILSVVDVAVLPYPRLPAELWFSPLKLYEYMAAGKAVLASRTGQISEVIKDNHNGVLVEAGNVDELAQSIIRLLNDPARREWLGENARQQALERHSWKQYIRRLEQIYQSVL